MASQEKASLTDAATGAFGAWLREAREKLGRAQREVAAAAGMDSSHYGKVESGKRFLTDPQLPKVADCLGLDPDALTLRMQAAEFFSSFKGGRAQATAFAELVQEHAAAYLVNNPADNGAKKLRTKK